MYTHTEECYSTLKKDTVQYAMTLINCENINQPQKDKHCLISFYIYLYEVSKIVS